VTPARRERTMNRMTDPAAPNPAPPDLGRLRAALAEAARWYRERLLTDRPPLVVAVLRDRGLVDLAADTPPGRRWQLGYAPASRGSAALVQHLRGCGFSDRELLDAGVAVPGRYGGVIDALRHRLVVPLIDSPVEGGVDGGGVVGFTARRLSDADTAVPKWVNTATTALHRKGEHLFGRAQQADLITARRGQPVLVEGAVDAIAVNLAGHIGLAAGGTRLTPAHAAQKLPAVLGVPAMPPRVWGVWDGEDLVGVYAEEQVARADAAVLQRDAVRAGVRASTIDCLALPLRTTGQHGRRGR